MKAPKSWWTMKMNAMRWNELHEPSPTTLHSIYGFGMKNMIFSSRYQIVNNKNTGEIFSGQMLWPIREGSEEAGGIDAKAISRTSNWFCFRA